MQCTLRNSYVRGRTPGGRPSTDAITQTSPSQLCPLLSDVVAGLQTRFTHRAVVAQPRSLARAQRHDVHSLETRSLERLDFDAARAHPCPHPSRTSSLAVREQGAGRAPGAITGRRDERWMDRDSEAAMAGVQKAREGEEDWRSQLRPAAATYLMSASARMCGRARVPVAR